MQTKASHQHLTCLNLTHIPFSLSVPAQVSRPPKSLAAKTEIANELHPMRRSGGKSHYISYHLCRNFDRSELYKYHSMKEQNKWICVLILLNTDKHFIQKWGKEFQCKRVISIKTRLSSPPVVPFT